MGRGATLGIDPALISGRVLHCRADSGIHLETATQRVEQWDDLSGLGHHLLQVGVGTLKPLLGAGPNGQPAVIFDGIDDYIRASFTLAQPETVLVVFKYTSGNYIFDAYAGVFKMCGSITSPTTTTMLAAGGNTTGAISNVVGTWVCSSWIFNSISFIRFGGGRVGTGNSGEAGQAANGLIVGNAGNLGGACNVAIAEIVVYNRALTEAEMLGIERYFGNRYGITPVNARASYQGAAPASIPNLLSWYRADVGNVTLDGSNNVSQWNDISGGGNHAAQTTPAYRPPYNTSPLNGLPTLTFTLHALIPLSAPATTVSTLFVAFRARTSAGNVSLIQPSNFIVMYQRLATAANWGAYNNAETPSGTTLVAGTSYILEQKTRAPTDIDFVTNGSLANVTSGGILNSRSVVIGAANAGLAQPAQADIAEIIFYNRALTAQESAGVRRYLGNRYGIFVG